MAIVSIVALAALLCTVGADAQWLAALGHVITTRGAIPRGIPFAAAPTGHWPNALVLSELVLNYAERLAGDRGLMLAQLLATATALAFLARDARARGAQPLGTSAALLAVGLGALPSLAIARVQLFSLALFAVLVGLLRAQSRRPSWRVWLVVPLIAVWSNLHGAALVGELVTLAYLLVSRFPRERWLASCVAVVSAAALCLTPALLRTIDYYQGVLTNDAARRGEGMWSPLSLSSPIDIALIVASVFLVARAWRARPALWEWCVIVGLAILTLKASRDGVWLLFFLAAPAAVGITPKRSWRALVPVITLASLLAIGFAVVRGPISSGASRALVADAVSIARGSPVLASGVMDEQVALAGGRIWVGNPIDAFSHADQVAYLDWLDGVAAGRRALAAQVRVVLVSRGSETETLMQATPGFVAVGGDATTALYERVGKREL
jgi:hypothetical protein